MLRKVIFVAVAAGLASGCVTRFKDNFESDAAGSPPATYPAGSPDDRLQVLRLGPGNVRVEATSSLGGAKAMRISGPGGDGQEVYSNTVYMYAEAVSSLSQPVYARWSGEISAGAGAVMRFFQGHFDTMLEVKLENGAVRVNGASVGTYTPGRMHSILLRVSPNGSYGVSLLGAAEGSTTGTLNGFTRTSSAIGMSAELRGGGASDYYRMDDIVMSERRPK